MSRSAVAVRNRVARAGPQAAGWWSVAWLLAVLLLLAAPYALATPVIFVLNDALIAVLFAASLNLIMGYGGMLSFGHAAYYALGAYSAGLLLRGAHWPAPFAMLAAPVVAAAGALVFGYFCVRTNRTYFIMLTLAFAQLLYTVIVQWYGFTHGDDGLSGINAGGWLASPAALFRVSVVVVAVCLLVLFRIVHSPFGYTLRAIAENARRASFLGLPARRYRLAAFVIAGAFAGVAGMLFAFYNGSISPDTAYWTESAQPFIAVILGGSASFWGVVAGGTILSLLQDTVSHHTQYANFWVGVVTLAVGLFLRQGLSSLRLRGARR